MSTNTKLVIDIKAGTEELIPMTVEEIAARDAHEKKVKEEKTAMIAEEQARADLKKSARAKLVAGEKLTEEEAKIIVL